MQTFKKEERLSKKKVIDQLFTNGSSFILYPFRIVWQSAAGDSIYPAAVGISVPKRKFKKAVDRNRIKRIFREVYRKNKEEHFYTFLREHHVTVSLMFIYVGNEVFTYQETEKKLNSAFERFKDVYGKSI